MRTTMYRVLFAGLVLALTACGAGQVKKQVVEEGAPLSMLDTLIYLPKQKVDDKTGLPVPYEPRVNPYTDAKVRIDKEAVQKYIAARRAFKAKNFKQTEALLAEIIAIDDKLSGPWVMRGDIALDQGKTEQAIEFFEKAKSINPKNVNVYLRLAKLHREAGRFLLAQNIYTEALAVWPDFPEAHLNLGILYDIYLNHPLRAVDHMAAYQFLIDEEDAKVAAWIKEIEGRTGVKTSLMRQ